MRRLTFVTRASWWCLLGLALSLGAGAVMAQDQVPVVVVQTNATKKVGMGKNQVIAEVRNENPKVVRVQSILDDPTAVLVTGLAPGRSRVTFVDTKKNMESIEVQVIDQDLELLRKEFLEQVVARVPGAQVQAQISAGKVILTGTVPDQASLRAVMEMARNYFGERVSFAMQLPEAVKERFIQQITRAIPGSKVDVFIDAGNIIVSGYAADQASIRAIEQAAKNAFGPDTVVAVSIAGQEPAARIPRVQQVELEVIVAVVQRSELRRLSFNWIINRPNYFVSSIINSPLEFLNDVTASTAGATANASAVGSNLTFGVVGDKTSFTGFLQALRNEGLAKILSEPRLVTLSGQRAVILSGGETPVLTTSGEGSPTIEFKPFGTRVNFVPVVLENGKIQIEVNAEISARNDANGIFIGGATPTQIPGFDKRSVQSVVHIEDCQTLAIGGLIQNIVNASIQKIPVLGDIPFLGTAFSSSNYDVREEEMLILVTPRLVAPMACCQLPKFLPGRETRPADDFELFLTQILEAPRGPREVCPDGKFLAAHHTGPSAAMFPCGDASGGWHGRCAGGACGIGVGHHGVSHGHGCSQCSRPGCSGCGTTVPSLTPHQMQPVPHHDHLPAVKTTESHVTPASFTVDAMTAAPLPRGPETYEYAAPVPIRDYEVQGEAPAIPVMTPGDFSEPPQVLPALGPAAGR